MRIFLQNIRLRQEFDRIKAMYFVQLGIMFFALIYEFYSGIITFNHFVIKVSILLVVNNLCYKTLKRLYYTFWTFSFLIGIHLVMNIMTNFLEGDQKLFYLYSFSLFLLIINCYLLSSPIYYPRVAWWEYDFRFRKDLKIEVESNNKKYDGRISDLRREAGCLVLFQDLDIGQNIEIEFKDFSESRKFNAEIMSKRENNVGRGVSYGIKFQLATSELKGDYLKFLHEWDNDKSENKYELG